MTKDTYRLIVVKLWFIVHPRQYVLVRDWNMLLGEEWHPEVWRSTSSIEIASSLGVKLD
jgi:hypothetical protein